MHPIISQRFIADSFRASRRIERQVVCLFHFDGGVLWTQIPAPTSFRPEICRGTHNRCDHFRQNQKPPERIPQPPHFHRKQARLASIWPGLVIQRMLRDCIHAAKLHVSALERRTYRSR